MPIFVKEYKFPISKECAVIVRVGNVDDKIKPFLPEMIKCIKKSVMWIEKYISANTKEFIVELRNNLATDIFNVSSAAGFANSDGIDAAPGQPNIVLFPNHYLKQTRDKTIVDKAWLTRAMRHELRHIIDLKKNEKIKMHSFSISRINSIINKIQTGMNVVNPNFAEIRIAYSLFLRSLVLEGLARQVENLYRLNKTNLIKLYKQAIKESQYLVPNEHVSEGFRQLRSFVNFGSDQDLTDYLKKVKEKIAGAAYNIGWHMVFTIRYTFPQIHLRNFVSMGPFELIKTYEKACVKLGIKPVVTYNTGTGYFDYNTVIKKLYNVFTVRKPTQPVIKSKARCPGCKKITHTSDKMCYSCNLDLTPQKCPVCRREVNFQFSNCPYCLSIIHKKVPIVWKKFVPLFTGNCPECNNKLKDVRVCPYCGYEF